jgi:hypothetical protein
MPPVVAHHCAIEKEKKKKSTFLIPKEAIIRVSVPKGPRGPPYEKYQLRGATF